MAAPIYYYALFSNVAATVTRDYTLYYPSGDVRNSSSTDHDLSYSSLYKCYWFTYNWIGTTLSGHTDEVEFTATPPSSDYSFIGWYTTTANVTAASQYSSSSVASIATVLVSSAATVDFDTVESKCKLISYGFNSARPLLVAKFATKPTVSFDANGGTGAPSAVRATVGGQVAIPATEPTREGYAFLGWATSASAATATYFSGHTYTASDFTSDATLYAVWRAGSGIVVLNANGGVFASADLPFVYATTAQAIGALPTPTLAGHTFQGWYTAQSGGTLVTASTVYSPDIPRTLYAHWQATQAAATTITLNPNGGSVSPATVSVREGSSFGALQSPTLAGYDFQGWYTALDGGTLVTASTVYTSAIPTTLYARWQASTPSGSTSAARRIVKYRLVLNLNGGSIDAGYELKYVKGYPKTLPTPTREGYTFGGWYADEAFATTPVTTQPSTAKGTKTYYAKWL